MKNKNYGKGKVLNSTNKCNFLRRINNYFMRKFEWIAELVLFIILNLATTSMATSGRAASEYRPAKGFRFSILAGLQRILAFVSWQ
jgi:hypothetical protein